MHSMHRVDMSHNAVMVTLPDGGTATPEAAEDVQGATKHGGEVTHFPFNLHEIRR